MTPRAGLVLTPGAFYELGRSPQGDATYQISNLYAIQFQKRKIFEDGLLFSYVPTCDPWGWASFDPEPSYEQTW